MTGVIILAAGSSSRLGQPKQNLVYKGSTLLAHALEAALDSVCRPVVVVLGANAGDIVPVIGDLPVAVVQNEAWQEGMASSIVCGLSELLLMEPAVSDVVIMVCDQPYVNAEVLNKLVQLKSESGKEIVACAYKDTLGTPVLFDQRFFDELLALRGQEGAKKLLFRHRELVAAHAFPSGAIDIDTSADYSNLIAGELA